MDEVDYIYDFLHDGKRHRWPEPTVNYLLTMAEEELRSKAEAFLKLRSINREKAQLKQMGTHDETVDIQLIEGKDIYNLPEDFLRVSSVIYEGCFIPHQITSCSDSVDCDDPSSMVRAYNTSGLPKGKMKISPVPQKWIDCETETTTECVNVETRNECAMVGWGFINLDPNIQITSEEHQVITEKTELKLGKISVTYEVADKLVFSDDDNEVIEALVNDKQLRKFYVCGHLLRDDKDSNSRSLGAEELALFDGRTQVLLGKYIELYDVDNVLELSSADEGYVDTKTNNDVIDKDMVDIRRDELAASKKVSTALKRKSKFEILGTRR